ncbi:PfkB family carbohydrate kinase [Microbacterium foliorum]|uniref:PfkB family carbohydrate kinase n=1 Tax=Microbacterium foliorum TaxID=104336 RepID=UPI00099F7587|nr:hypothetical protein B2G67_10480 [Microbacterium foliorum]
MPDEVRFLVVGEALVDVITEGGTTTERPGGSPANVALTLGRLGHHVTLRTALGSDRHGILVSDWLRMSNVRIESVPLTRTSTAAAVLGVDGAAAYTFDIEWPATIDTTSPAEHIHAGSIGAWMAPGADDVALLVAKHTSARCAPTVSFDPNIRPALVDSAEVVRARCDALAFSSEIIKLSDEDLRWLYPGRSEHSVVTEWLDAGALVAVVTEGGAGARAYTRGGESVAVPARVARVVDTIGAGDTFMGAFLASLGDLGYLGARNRGHLAQISAHSLRAAMRRAIDAASVTVSRSGMDPPAFSEIGTADAYFASHGTPTGLPGGKAASGL